MCGECRKKVESHKQKLKTQYQEYPLTKPSIFVMRNRHCSCVVKWVNGHYALGQKKRDNWPNSTDVMLMIEKKNRISYLKKKTRIA